VFLRATTGKKDGKEHRCYWSVVEKRRVAGGRVVQRHVLYSGEINSSQELAWRKSIDVLEDGQRSSRTAAGGLLLLKNRAQFLQKRKNHEGLKDCAIAQWRRV
jgi:hypothetical protein